MSDSSYRWEWAGSPEAASVPEWLRPGKGRDGALHATLLHLVRMRESNARNPEFAYRPLEEIHTEAVEWRELSADDTRGFLDALVGWELAECSDTGWRPTDKAVRAIQEAYADRHPMTEPGPTEG